MAQQDKCNALLQKIVESGKSTMMSTAKFNSIVEHLKNPSAPVTAHFRHWVKSKEFQVLDLPALNLKDELVVPSKSSKPGAQSQLRVLHADQLYEVVNHIHSTVLMHAGYKKTLEFMQ